MNPESMDPETPTHMRRKRSYSKAGLFVASAVALSLSTGSNAFQTPMQSMRSNQASNSKLDVVTDPKQMMEIDLEDMDGFDRRTLEDIYLIATTDSDGLSGEMVEGKPTRRQSKPRMSTKIKKTKITKSRAVSNPDAIESDNMRKASRVQFKGLTMGPDGRYKKDSLSRTAPKPRSTISRSSTMPGLTSSSKTGNMLAFEDGIKIAEQRSGMKYIDTPEKQTKLRQTNGEIMYKNSASVPDSLVSFANQIHGIDRITPKEELVLGEKTQEAIRLQKIFDTLEVTLDREPTDAEWCAAAGKINMEHLSQAIEEGLEAKNKLVTANLRMVQGVVNVYIRNGLRSQYNAGDLMQEGVMALIRAAEKFDPTRGFRFSTYAMYWIRSSIKRGQVHQSKIVSVPQRLHENHKRILKTQVQLRQELGRTPTKVELAKASDMTEVQLERCLMAMSQKCLSLDQKITNTKNPNSADGEDTMYDLVESKTDDVDYNSVKHGFLREDLIATLQKHLTEEEVNLLLLRYGLFEYGPKSIKNGPLTIAEVSQTVGYKPDKVRRMINRSLKHMKSVIGTEWIEYERELQ